MVNISRFAVLSLYFFFSHSSVDLRDRTLRARPKYVKKKKKDHDGSLSRAKKTLTGRRSWERAANGKILYQWPTHSVIYTYIPNNVSCTVVIDHTYACSVCVIATDGKCQGSVVGRNECSTGGKENCEPVTKGSRGKLPLLVCKPML